MRYFAGALIAALMVTLSACSGSAHRDGTPAPVAVTATSDPPGPPNGDLTEANKLALRVQQLSALATELNIDHPPDVALVRWTKPWDKSDVAKCVNDQGFAATANGGNLTFDPGLPKAQVPAFNTAYYTCMAKYTADPRYTQPLSRAALGRVYDWITTVQVPCYRSLGINTSQPPSREVWIDAYDQGQRSGNEDGVWLPSNEITDQDRATVAESCAPAPPNDLVFGEGSVTGSTSRGRQ